MGGRYKKIDSYKEMIRRGNEVVMLEKLVNMWRPQLPETFVKKASEIFRKYNVRNEEKTYRDIRRKNENMA